MRNFYVWITLAKTSEPSYPSDNSFAVVGASVGRAVISTKRSARRNPPVVAPFFGNHIIRFLYIVGEHLCVLPWAFGKALVLYQAFPREHTSAISGVQCTPLRCCRAGRAVISTNRSTWRNPPVVALTFVNHSIRFLYDRRGEQCSPADKERTFSE